MTRKDFQTDLTGEACPGCGGEVVLISSEGAVTVECPCSAVTVDAA